MMDLPVQIGALVAGKYRVERVIGQGGMGVVVSAIHDELDQRVAIKFLSGEGAKGTEWITRFAREAKTAAKIRNEHAVKVFDVGKLDKGIPYMVMEYLDGQNLDEILDHRRTLPLEEAADYVLQACEALAEAHLLGIVHRDLKPANLVVTHRGDGTTCVKILDFGISKVTDDEAHAPSITTTSALVGSPLYMSPERLRGGKDVDRRADIWSLGVLLQEMLTGLPPFSADTIPDIHALVLTSQPTPLRTTMPSAPSEIETLILKCLAKAPGERFQNVHEFAAALAIVAPKSQGSVDRIANIVSGSGRRSRTSSADVSGSFPPEPGTGPRAKLAETLGAPVTESVPSISATRTGEAVKRSRLPFVVMVATGLLAVALGAVLFVATTRARHPQALAAPKKLISVEGAANPLVGNVGPAPTVTAADMPTVTDAAEDVTVTKHAPGHRRRPAASASASAAAPPPSQDPSGFIDYGGRN